jgi:hypothetical protein
MEVDLMVELESRPIKLEVTFDIEIFFGDVDVSNKAEGYALVQASTSIEAKTHFGGTIDLMFFGTIVKDKHTNSVVGTRMEVAILILVQLEAIAIPIATTPNPFTTMKDLGVDVRVEVIEATIMEN